MATQTSQAFRNALHVPLADPVSGNVIAVQDPGGDWYPSAWSSASGLPEAPLDHKQYARSDATWVVVDLTAAAILAKLLTVDGTGSGLDADMLDGLDSSAFATKTYVDTAVGNIDCGTY
jgi:hypothetical protein